MHVIAHYYILIFDWYNFTENSREYRYSTALVYNVLNDKEISKRNASTKAS